MEHTKQDLRREAAYIRDLLRQAEAALKSGSLDDLNAVAHDLVGSASTYLAYCEERGCEV